MKAVLVHGLLAVFGLGFAYQTWTREPDVEETPGAITVAECREGDFQKLQLETESNYISVEPRREKNETLYWISITRKVKEKPKPEAANADAGVAAQPPKAEEAPKPKVFLANAAFKDYLKQVMPLRAMQGLGTLPKDKLADFGFDKVDTKFQLECAGKQVAMEAGARTFGSGQRYVRDVKSKAAYLFKDELVTDLQSAQFKYMQTEMHPFSLADVEEATVEVRGTKKRLLQRDRKQGQSATWVDASAASKRNELYGNWFARVWRMKAREYLEPGAQPGSDLKASGGELRPVLRIDYKVDGKPNGTLELVKVDEGTVAHYYARSDSTRNWVTVFDATAKEVEQDAAMVVGLEEAPPSKTEPAKAGEPAETSTSVHGAAPHGLPKGHPSVPGNPHGRPPPKAPVAPPAPNSARPPANPHAH